MSARHRIGVLLSGRGSNFLALAEAAASGAIPDAEIALVLSDREDAPGLLRARELGIAATAVPQRGRGDRDRAMLERLRAHGVEWVCLAGYMRLLSGEFVQAYPERILNVHPSLLPAFPGLAAQQQALEYGARMAGCTVHFVDEQLDHGVIVAQAAVPVLAGDNVKALSERILAEEHRIYPRAVARVLRGGWHVEGRRFVEIVS